MTLPFPSASSVYLDDLDLGGAGGRCAHCTESKAAHTWVCGGCGKTLARGDQSPGLHVYKHHPPGMRHSSTPFLICPVETARRARQGSPWAESEWHEPPQPQPRRRAPPRPRPAPRPAPRPDPNGIPRTYEDAWAFFNTPASMTDAKTRYRAFVARWHPDREQDPKKKSEAEMQLKRANAAWALLQKLAEAIDAAKAKSAAR